MITEQELPTLYLLFSRVGAIPSGAWTHYFMLVLIYHLEERPIIIIFVIVQFLPLIRKKLP
jgi:hypothetical protein